MKVFLISRMIKEFYTSEGFTIDACNEETGIIGYLPVYADETRAQIKSENVTFPIHEIEIKDE